MRLYSTNLCYMEAKCQKVFIHLSTCLQLRYTYLFSLASYCQGSYPHQWEEGMNVADDMG